MFRRKKKQDGEQAAPAAAADMAAEDDQIALDVHENAVSSTSASSSTTNNDGGARLYLELSQKSATNVSSSPSAALATKKSTKEGAAKLAARSSAVQQARLMREIKLLAKSESVKNHVFSFELADDLLHEWDVKIYEFDHSSPLYEDLQMMKRCHGIDNIWLRFSFPDNFPFGPPFVRVLAPYVQGGYVLNGGAVCLELLTPDGWSEAYKMEAVILQVLATIIEGGARIVKSVRKQFSEAEAKRAYDYLVKVHRKHGWKTMPAENG